MAIGFQAGFSNQGTGSVAIGFQAGQTNQPANSIVINAQNTALNGASTGACYISPLRGIAASTAVYYNSTTFELSYLTSSETTKSDIAVLDQTVNPTSVLYNLVPKTYTYNSCPEAGKQIGYIAEEAALLNNKFATYNNIGDTVPAAIDYNVINVFAVEEIKRLNTKITSMSSNITNLINIATELNKIILGITTPSYPNAPPNVYYRDISNITNLLSQMTTN